MKLWVAGATTVVGVIGAALTGGAGGTDDYGGVVKQSPQTVYAAFAALGGEGVEAVPIAGLPLSVTQRITKVPNEQVRLEVMVEGDVLLTADIHLAPAEGGQATQVDAELDVVQAPFERVIEARGGRVPSGVLDHARIDNMFRSAMTDMMAEVEAGRPLRPIGAILSGWDAERSSGSAAPRRIATQAQQREPVRPQWGSQPEGNSSFASGADPAGAAVTPGGWGKR